MVVTRPGQIHSDKQVCFLVWRHFLVLTSSRSILTLNDSTLEFLFLMQICCRLGPVLGTGVCSIYTGPETWEIITCFVFITAQPAELLRAAGLVCLSLSRHPTCEGEGHDFIVTARILIKQRITSYWQLTVHWLTPWQWFQNWVIEKKISGLKAFLSVPSLTNLLSVLRSVYLPAVPAAAASSGQCSLSLSGVKIVKISPHWGLEPGPLGN